MLQKLGRIMCRTLAEMEWDVIGMLAIGMVVRIECIAIVWIHTCCSICALWLSADRQTDTQPASNAFQLALWQKKIRVNVCVWNNRSEPIHLRRHREISVIFIIWLWCELYIVIVMRACELTKSSHIWIWSN